MAQELSLFLELGVIIIFSTMLAMVFRKFHQPSILAYLLSGIILGASFFNIISFQSLLGVFSTLGIAFLLFLVGLNLNTNVLREIGRVSITTGIVQIFLTTVFGVLISSMFGFSLLESLYVGLAISFSSTIIIVKCLTDKRELNSLHGRISIGFLLTQDFVAIIALLLVSSFAAGSTDIISSLAGFAVKGTILFASVLVLGKSIVQWVFRSAAKSQELLFLSSISWCLFLAGLSSVLGFSIEVGAFLAGVSIASLPYSFEISSRLKNLRDFFLVLFFVSLGSQLAFSSFGEVIVPSLVFSAFIIFGNPLIVISIMLFLGYKARTSFMAGLTVAQISEFSLILVNLGARVGHIGGEVVSMVTLIGIITIAADTFILYNSEFVYSKFFSWLSRFERKKISEKNFSSSLKPEFVFFGFGETGKSVFQKMGLEKDNAFVVDFDPKNVESLKTRGFNVLFADAGEPEAVNEVLSFHPKAIFVSSDNFDTNLDILKAVKLAARTKTICVASTHSNALKLYSFGADFVIVPKIASAEKTAQVLASAANNEGLLSAMRVAALNELNSMEKDF
ncbi:MAG: cation:proton antiporter [archaeon]|nr:cation:proton antiporter [archaeon]